MAISCPFQQRMACVDEPRWKLFWVTLDARVMSYAPQIIFLLQFNFDAILYQSR